jgi:hypothetical protein
MFIPAGPQKETQMDKTARVVRRITEDEAELRHVKTTRLRRARFESEASTPVDATKARVVGSRK